MEIASGGHGVQSCLLQDESRRENVGHVEKFVVPEWMMGLRSQSLSWMLVGLGQENERERKCKKTTKKREQARNEPNNNNNNWFSELWTFFTECNQPVRERKKRENVLAQGVWRKRRREREREPQLSAKRYTFFCAQFNSLCMCVWTVQRTN